MDRKGKQKIRYRIVVSLIFLVSVFILFICSIRYESRLREEQRQELEIIYPEIKTELLENFTFYQKQSLQSDIMFFAGALLLMIFFVLVMILLCKREKKAQDEWIKEETGLVYEQLQRFHQGDFQIRPELDEMETEEMWISIHEKLRELGYYFSDMKERLTEEENNTKSLITDISHQLKTPLASIRMCRELALSEDLTEEEKKDFLETEGREIQKLEMLLDELVKLSRLENNMIQIRPEKRSLKQTVSEAVSQVYMKAFEKKIEIGVEMEEDIEIFHDRKWTAEAFTNVLENAVKYSECGTDIAIRVNRLPNNALIEMEDEGMGISEEELHKIFRRFYRGSKAKEKVKDGAGVGLYLARSIIEQQGGTILAKRKPDKGTVFKIMFPL